MNPDYKGKWLEALRSGKYKQGTAALHMRTSDRYCCLGVLCEVSAPKEKMAIVQEVDTLVDSYYGYTTCLAPELEQLFDITDEEQHILIGMNDEQELSFEQIAQYIEENM